MDVKPWSNGVASSRKLRTWVYLRLRLARACVHLRWLAMTCAHFGRGQICTQVKASFSPFGHPTQVNASWATSINLWLANEIQDMSALKWVFLRLTCTWEETCESVWSPKSLRKFNLRPLATTCRSVWPGLYSTCVDLGWVAKRWKTCVDLRANLISSPGQTESQIDCKLRTCGYLRLRLARA